MSDEIPVGSPPAPPGRHAAPGGWYADPSDPTRERYWDGWQWSRQTREAQARAKRSRDRGRAPAAPMPRPREQQPGSQPPRTPQSGSQQGPTPPVPEGPGSLAGWWHRAGAAALDWLIVTLVTTAVLAPLYWEIGERMRPILGEMFVEALAGRQPSQLRPAELMSQQEQMIILLVTMILGVAYHALLLKWRGATLGKLITGLRVVSAGATDQPRPGLAGLAPVPEAAEEGGPLTWRQAMTRAMVWVFPGQHTCLWPIRILDIIMPISDPQNRALHDRMAGTLVVRSR